MIAKNKTGHVLACAVLMKHEVAAVQRMSEYLIDLFEAGTPVSPREVSRLIDRAEECLLVNRSGMVHSGLAYVFTEKAARATGVTVSAEQGMTTAKHIFNQATRAMSILGNPNGYIPRLHQPLYGSATGSWKPLLP